MTSADVRLASAGFGFRSMEEDADPKFYIHDEELPDWVDGTTLGTERDPLRRDVNLWVDESETGGPQAGALHWHPGDQSGAHFHRVDQFQLFFGSNGAYFQRTTIPPGSVLVQYSDAYTVYGPFGTRGPEGFSTLTARAIGDPVIAYTPGSEHMYTHKGRRRIASMVEPTGGRGIADGQVVVEEFIEPAADGLRCALFHGGPGAEVEGPDPAATGGQYYCILGGAVVVGDRRFGPKALAWRPRDISALSFRAPADVGFEVLLMQFPNPPSVPPPAPVADADIHDGVYAGGGRSLTGRSENVEG